MPEVHSFRALHYDTSRAGDLSRVVGQPYDKIDDRLQAEYYRRHPHHIVRIDKRMEEPGDSSGEKKYAAAAETLRAWIREGVLVQETEPALYAVHQTYRAGTATRTRRGLYAMVRLEEFGKGRIHPHEETHTGPKVDRLKLLRATETHFAPILMLYSDPSREVNRLLDSETSSRPPGLRAVDDAGETHEAWRLADPSLRRRVEDLMAPKDAIIADGHHRYETALAYRAEGRAADRRGEGGESFENVLTTLINMDDEGLTCFGTHRLIRDRPPLDGPGFLQLLDSVFDVKTFPFTTREEERRARMELLEDLRVEGMSRPAFGMALPNVAHALLRARDTRALAARVRSPRSEAWRSLDVNILHAVVLEEMLGITPDDTAHERFVDYYRLPDEAVERVLGGKAVAAFLVNPVRMDQIRTIVMQGERFPQKTTDFYPKMLAGFLMCRLHPVS